MPYKKPYKADTFSSPVIGDINNDGLLEIIRCDEYGNIYLLDFDKNYLWINSDGEPSPYSTDGAIKSTPAIGDIDKDGKEEIIVGCDDGKIYCISNDKKLEWSFNTYSPVRSTPSIANVDVSTEELEIMVGSDNGVTYCLNSDGSLNWQYPAVGEEPKGAFKITPIAVDLNSYPDGGYETVAMSEDGHLYCLDTVGAVDNTDWVDDYYSDGTSDEYPSYRASLALADINEDEEVDIIFGPTLDNKEDDSDYNCYTNAIKWGMFGAGTKHNGNGDNRFAILIEGSQGIKNNPGETFQQEQFEANIQEIGRLLTEHPNNIKPGPGYTGYYLQDHIYYVGVHDEIPELNRDKIVDTKNGKANIILAIQEVARKCDSYDKVLFFYTAYGGKTGGTAYFDADNSNSATVLDLDADTVDNYLDAIDCKDIVIILQPDYSGDWINDLKNDKYQKNRLILTSDKAGETGGNGKEYDFDLCNKEISSGSINVYYVGWDSTTSKQFTDNDAPKIDYEEYSSFPIENLWQYKATKYNDVLYEIERESTPDGTDFYENWNDNGVEFVSGLTEALFIDRFTGSTIESNGNLDADESTTNAENGYSHFPSITAYSNDYISCKEAYNYMKLWHLGYRLNKNTANDPWYDEPKIEYIWLEEGGNYLF